MTTFDPTTTDLSTLDGAMALVRYVQASVRKDLARDGYHVPLAFVFARRNPETGATLDRVRPVLMVDLHDMDGGETAEALRGVARATDAVGVLLVRECWVLDDRDAGEGATDAVRAAGAQLRDHPKSRDAVMMLFEHRALATGATLWTALVTPEGVGEWSEREGAQGRMTGILPGPARGVA